MACPYDGAIRPLLPEGSEVKPHHVEAWMRLEWGTLNHLPQETFESETRMVLFAVRRGDITIEELGRIAESMGVRP